MEKINCPFCGCKEFYVKDPDDDYEVYEFECGSDGVVFQGESTDIDEDRETYCGKCAWHDKFKTLKKT